MRRLNVFQSMLIAVIITVFMAYYIYDFVTKFGGN